MLLVLHVSALLDTNYRKHLIHARPRSTTFTGVITSGIPSPTLGTNIAMGYVASGHHKKGTKVKVKVRRNMRDAVVKPMPFVPTKYFRQAGPI